MGLLGLLKSIFETKQENQVPIIEEQNIPIAKLESWFAEKEVIINKEVELLLQEVKPRLLEGIKNCEQACDKLRNAQPRYPELYQRGKIVVDGNRAAFIIATENFLKSIKLHDSAANVVKFVQDFEESFTNLSESSNKSFIISKEIFTEETLAIRASLHEIDRTISNIAEKAQNTKLAELPQVSKQIADLNKRLQQNTRLEIECKDVEHKLQEIAPELVRAKEEYDAFVKSPDFLQKQKLEAEIKSVQEQIKVQEDEIYNIIATLDAPLRKLAWKYPEYNKLIEKYLNNLVAAITQDTDLKFEGILSRLKSAIESGEIDLKDNKRSQALKNLNNLTKFYLRSWLESNTKDKDKEKELREQLATSTAAIREVELKTKLQKLDANKDSIEKQKATILRAQKRTDLDKDIETISATIASALDSKVKILKN